MDEKTKRQIYTDAIYSFVAIKAINEKFNKETEKNTFIRIVFHHYIDRCIDTMKQEIPPFIPLDMFPELKGVNDNMSASEISKHLNPQT